MKAEYISVPVPMGQVSMQVAGPESEKAILFIHGRSIAPTRYFFEKYSIWCDQVSCESGQPCIKRIAFDDSGPATCM